MRKKAPAGARVVEPGLTAEQVEGLALIRAIRREMLSALEILDRSERELLGGTGRRMSKANRDKLRG